MTEDELYQELTALGLQNEAWRHLLLFPLVEVSWANGQVKPAERDVIAGEAERQGLLDDAGRQLLDRWLSAPPEPAVCRRVRRVLRRLVNEDSATGHAFARADLDRVLQAAERVAIAEAGVLGGIFGRTGNKERSVLEELRQELLGPERLGPRDTWPPPAVAPRRSMDTYIPELDEEDPVPVEGVSGAEDVLAIWSRIPLERRTLALHVLEVFAES